MNEVADSMGGVLRRKREDKKLTLEQVHNQTKISIQVLRSIEQDDFGAFESEIYLKGFVKNYSDFLGLNHANVWRKYRQTQSDPSGDAAMWDTEASVVEEKLQSPQLFKRFVLPVMILLILLLAFLFIRERQKVDRMSGSGQTYYYYIVADDGDRAA